MGEMLERLVNYLEPTSDPASSCQCASCIASTALYREVALSRATEILELLHEPVEGINHKIRMLASARTLEEQYDGVFSPDKFWASLIDEALKP